MTNRLRNYLRILPILLGFIPSFLLSGHLNAQFTFTPPFPNTFAVGANCLGRVSETTPPTVTSTLGNTIVVSQFSPTNAYLYTDTWAATVTVNVIWYVEDDMGNSQTYNYPVTFVDLTPPIINPNGQLPVVNLGSVVQIIVPAPALTATDNCTAGPQIVYGFSETPFPDTCEAGTVIRIWTATDQAGNTAYFTQTINIAADNVAPIVSVSPQSTASSCELAPAVYATWLATSMASFAASDASGIREYTNNAPPTFPSGCSVPVTVIFRAYDNCGFNFPVTATFTTSDTEPPVIIGSARDTVAYCSNGGNQINKLKEWINQRAFFTSMDSCSLPQSYTMKIGTLVVDSAQVVAAFNASIANGCSNQQVGIQMFQKVRAKVNVKFFVKDACGHESFAGDADFAAIDTLAPVITGVNTTEQCGGGNDQANVQTWINAKGNATVADDCSGTSWTNFSYTTSDGQTGTGNFGSGSYPQVRALDCNWFTDVTFRSTDECGNIGLKTLRFTIFDNTKPVISGYPSPVTLDCINPVPSIAKQFISDNCDTSMVLTQTFVYSDSLCDGSYTITATWRATDDCGNFGTAVQVFLVKDTNKPTFTLVPPNKTFYCDTFSLPAIPVMGVNIGATDLCSPVVSITTQTNSLQNPNPSVCAHYTYNIIRTFTATDECGNTNTATQTLSIVDNVGPVPQGILDSTANCNVLPTIPVPQPGALDACSGFTAAPVFLGQMITAGNCTDNYTLTLNWVAQDVCNNQTTFSQIVHVQDTIRPTLINIPANITVECDNIPVPPPLTSFGSNDNCDNTVTVSFDQSEIRDPSLTSCDHWTDYQIVREWTGTDNCGNARTYTQTIQVEDNGAPVLTPQGVLVVADDLGLCSAQVLIPPPLSLYDVCTSQDLNILLKDTSLLINTSGGSNNTTPVDTVVFQWITPNMAPNVPVIGNATFQIFIDNADISNAGEYFRVYGENGALIGTTTPTGGVGNCVSFNYSFTIVNPLINQWLLDGILTLRLVSNTVGGSVNAVCPGGRARGHVSYQYKQQYIPITLKYSIDAGLDQNFPPVSSVLLATGIHTIVYKAQDCVGNISTASMVIDVRDQQAPIIGSIPAQLNYVNIDLECNSAVTLPFPNVTENCDVSGSVMQSSAIVPIQFSDDLPTDMNLSINTLIPNAVTGGKLIIRHKGDNHDVGEFFKIYDENNVLLDSTSLGSLADECFDFHETIINVSAAQINQWAANGNTTIKISANDDVLGSPDVISPCFPILPDNTDGVSRIQATLMYSYAPITYEIRNNATGQFAVPPGLLNGSQTVVQVPAGVYTVKYLTTDIYGLEGMTTFTLTVRDTTDPTAKCRPKTLTISPSGLNTVTLNPSDVNNGSSDNCSPITLSVSPNMFGCLDALSPNNPFSVTLTVTDTFANSSTCQALVTINTIKPNTNNNGPVCEGDTLQLTAGQQSNVIYGYAWTNPQGQLFSSAPNPTVIPMQAINAGPYSVTITGPTGCKATNVTNVQMINFATTPAWDPTLDLNYCTGENVILKAASVNGVQYQWFRDSLPNSILLGTTNMPFFTINNPPVGTYRYYVRLSASSCFSAISALIIVKVFPKPVATVESAQIVVCEGQPITFGSNNQGVTFFWTGPGFQTPSTVAYPLVTMSADSTLHSGLYTLITAANGCSSNPVTVQVTVKRKPAKPQISGTSKTCTGKTIILVCNTLPGGVLYEWWKPNGQSVLVSSNINTYTINNATADSSGIWRVRVIRQGCYSDWSDNFDLSVQDYPDVSANVNAPICSNDTLFFNANANITLPANNWCWTGPIGSGFQRFEQNPILFPGLSGQYKVVGKTTNGCADSAFVNVTVIAKPVIDSIVNNAPVCGDGITNATLTPYTTNIGVTYSWKKPNGQTVTSPILVLPAVSSADNGTYTLIISNGSGCDSDPQTTLINVQNPLNDPMVTVPQPVCEGLPYSMTITNTSDYGPTSSFVWLFPNDTNQTLTQTSLSLPSPTLASMSGTYRVFVTEGSCKSDTTEVMVTINAIPAVPNIMSASQVCVGGSLQLDIEPVVLGVTYNWDGPNGFDASIFNPPVQPITQNNEGYYSVNATKNGCSSQRDSIFIDVIDLPATPTISPVGTQANPVAICYDLSGALISLNASPEPGAIYTWYNSFGNIIVGNTGPNLTITNLAPYGPGLHTFQVAVLKNGCNSFISDKVYVQLDTIPENINAFAGQNAVACKSLPIQLNATPPIGIITGNWTQTCGNFLPFTDASQYNTQVLNATVGNYCFRWSLSNGACTNFSSDTVNIQSVAEEFAKAGADIYICPTAVAQLSALQGVSAQGSWNQPVQFTTITDTLSPTTTVTNFTEGNKYFFYWEFNNFGCGVSSDTVNVFVYSGKPFAGFDEFICTNATTTTVKASPELPSGSFQSGKWSSPNAGIEFTSPNSTETTVSGLQTGPNILIWTMNAGVCGNNSKDTVIVDFELLPTAVEDLVLVDYAQPDTVRVLLNDVLPSQYSISIVSMPLFGDIDTIANGVFRYQPRLSYAGDDRMIYRICNLNCLDACSSATVTFRVSAPGDCVIPTIITPNNDGLNDVFDIPSSCLSGEGNAAVELTIFNQWGDQVFHQSNYNNTWDGTFDGRPLPVGTYYYFIRIGEFEPKKGFILIQR